MVVCENNTANLGMIHKVSVKTDILLLICLISFRYENRVEKDNM